MRKERQKTNVMMNVLDLTGLFAQALKDYNEKVGDVPAKSMKTKGTFAFVELDGKIWAMDDDGVGPNKPITINNTLDIPLYTDFDDGTVQLLPVFEARLNDAELRALPIAKTVELSEFIRIFGRRLEYNFNEWRKTLEKP